MKSKIKNVILLISFAFAFKASIAFAFLDPNAGRWIQRDPIGEQGGLNLYAYVGNNPLYYIDPLGLEVQLCTHAVFPPFQHSNLRLYPDNPENFPQKLLKTDPTDHRPYIALGAGPKHGKLVSKPNRDKDMADHPNHCKCIVSPPPGMSNDDFINSLLNADAAYQDNLKYHLFPGLQGGYNSNSYISGLLNATTESIYPSPSRFAPGWNNPVPTQCFVF